VTCVYCGNAIIVRRRESAQAQHTRQSQHATRTIAEPRRSSATVVVAALGGLILVGGLVAVLSLRSDPTGSAAAQERAVKQRVQAEKSLAEARSERAQAGVERAEVGAERAELGAERARLEAETIRAERGKSRKRQPRRAEKKNALPATPSTDAVNRIIARVNTNGCPGPGTVGYTIQIQPNGTTKIGAVGPIKGPGGMLSCIRTKIMRLRFPSSRDGLSVKRVFEIAGP